MLYGCSPFADKSAGELGLRAAMTLSSEIIGIQKLERGERIGYGFTYEAAAEMSVGIVACGYADGYPRHAPSGTPVLVNGKRTRTVGRVSMDMIAVDLSGMPDADPGTPVTLWGEDLSADEVAAAAGTLSYELLTKVTARVPFYDAE
jgi:alanine racemase